MSPFVSCVIVNFNGERFLEQCLRSLLGQTTPPGEIIVVDNASSDQSAQIIRTSFPQVDLLELSSNIGFAAACNRGIEASSGDLIAILNNDLELDALWLEALLSRVCEPWDFWASRIVFAGEHERIDSAGDGMAVVGSAYKIGHGDCADRFTTSREVFGPCAAAALYRRSLFEAVGSFDPDFFLVYEDADLNFRSRLMGFRCQYVPEAVVYHHLNASIGAMSATYVYFGHRNSEIVFWKNMPIALLLFYLPERILFNFLCLAYFLWRGKGLFFLKAKLDFLKLVPDLVKKRRKIQATRTLSTGEVRRLLDRNWLRHRWKTHS